MVAEAERYVLRGGKRGYDRLVVLARERWPDTLALLHRAGISPGMTAIDIGCGSGEVTFGLAGLVAPGGRAIGLDMDGVKLDLARHAATERGIGNAEFRQTNVNEWNEPGTYDAVYSRALLHHLRAPVDLLRRMWAAVRPGGVLVVEDADFGGWLCDPPNAGFDFFVRTYGETVRRNGGDPTIGRKLHRYFREVEIPDAQLTLVQGLRHEGEAKSLAWSTLEGSSDAILSTGLATEAEVAAALEDLARFTDDLRTLIVGPWIFQAWARR